MFPQGAFVEPKRTWMTPFQFCQVVKCLAKPQDAIMAEHCMQLLSWTATFFRPWILAVSLSRWSWFIFLICEVVKETDRENKKGPNENRQMPQSQLSRAPLSSALINCLQAIFAYTPHNIIINQQWISSVKTAPNVDNGLWKVQEEIVTIRQ